MDVAPRLLLRPFTGADAAWLHPIASDPVVTRFTDWGPNTPADTADFLARAAQTGTGLGSDELTWAVTLPDGTGIGSAGLEVTSRAHRRGSLGYVLGSPWWGRGHGTEVARALLLRARELDLHRVEATCHPDNAASARVLEKAGLRCEGRLRDHLLVRGAWRDSLLFAVVLPCVTPPTGAWARCAGQVGDRPQVRGKVDR